MGTKAEPRTFWVSDEVEGGAHEGADALSALAEAYSVTPAALREALDTGRAIDMNYTEPQRVISLETEDDGSYAAVCLMPESADPDDAYDINCRPHRLLTKVESEIESGL